MEELYQRLQSFRETAEMQSILELLQILLDAHKDELVNCADSDMQRVKGQAQAISSLLKKLRRPPPQTSAALGESE